MIAYLKGTLLDAGNDSCTVLTPGGVGYVLNVPGHFLQHQPELGSEIAFYVHTVVKEDALELFGFATQAELQTFKQLIAVSKLGPKTALAIISTYSPAQLQEILIAEDTARLSRVPGIGPKSAKRIIWELKEAFALQQVPAGDKHEAQYPQQDRMFADALAGLVNLGYSEYEVRPVLAQAMQEEPELMLQELIRKVLQQIARSRSGQ